MARRRLAVVREHAGRCLPYARVSELMGRGGESFHSPDVQFAVGERWYTKLGYHEVLPPSGQRVVDLDITGHTFSRAGLDEIRAAALAGLMDAISVKNIKRLGRNQFEGLKFCMWLQEHNIVVLAADEKIDDTEESQRRIGEYLMLAERQYHEIGDAWVEVIDRRADLGKHHGVPPEGYTRPYVEALGRTSGDILPHPDLWRAVRECFHRHAAGERMRDIVRWYREQTGRTLTDGGLKKMLRNPTYLGLIRVNDQPRPGCHSPILTGQYGEPDMATWATCQARLRADAVTPSRTLEIAWSMASLARCDVCGHWLHYFLRKEALKHGDVYYPRARHPGPQERSRECPAWGRPPIINVVGHVDVDELEKIVLTWIAQYVKNLKGDSSTTAEHHARRAQARTKLARLTRQLEETRDAIGELTGLLARKTITPQAYQLTAVDLEAAQAQLVAGIDGARLILAAEQPAQIVMVGEKLLKLWVPMTVAERNNTLRLILKEVRVAPATRRYQPLEGRVEPVPL